METLKKNKFSLIVAVIILFLSFSEAKTFDKISIFYIPHPDKIVHMGMYFVFTLTLVFENRVTIKKIKLLLLLSLISFFFGLIIEILQPVFTVTRSGEFTDLCFNVLGIVFAILSWRILQQSKK